MFHASNFNSFKVIKGSRFYADIRTDKLRTDERTEGKPIVPSGVNTGRGRIKAMLFAYIIMFKFKQPKP